MTPAAPGLAVHARGPADAPPVLLMHAIGTSHALWAPQVERLAATRRVITFDLRGHGASPAHGASCTLDDLGADALAVLDRCGVNACDVCGVSLGGLVGLWMARYAPDRVERVVAACTAARIGTAGSWQARIDLVSREGLEPVAVAAPARWFSEAYRSSHPDEVARWQATLASTPVEGYLACCAALRDADLRGELARIDRPLLAVAGRHDVATPVADAEVIARGVPGARLTVLDGGHLANIDAAEAFTATLTEFLDE